MLQNITLKNLREITVNKQLCIKFFSEFYDFVMQRDKEILAFVEDTLNKPYFIWQIEQMYEKYPDSLNRPPLFCVPIAVKDIFNVDNYIMRCGSQLPPAELQDKESEIVTELKKLGCIIVGKTHTTEFAFSKPAPTRNSHDFPNNLDLSPGGSSSGSAAAVAANFCCFALGTQTIGSVIRPAAYCNVIGFKPSFNKISTKGVFPFAKSFDHVGFFAQTLEDMKYLATILFEKTLISKIKYSEKINIAIPTCKYAEQPEKEIIKNFNFYIEHLKTKNVEIREVKIFDNISEINEMHYKLSAYEIYESHKDLYPRYKNLYSSNTAELIEKGHKISATEVELIKKYKIELLEEVTKFQTDNQIALWCMPATLTYPPLRENSTGSPLMNLPWTFLGFPTLSIVNQFDNSRVPMGIQFATFLEHDMELIDISAMINI